MGKSKVDEKADISVEEKLKALFELQQIDSKIDGEFIIKRRFSKSAHTLYAFLLSISF